MEIVNSHPDAPNDHTPNAALQASGAEQRRDAQPMDNRPKTAVSVTRRKSKKGGGKSAPASRRSAAEATVAKPDLIANRLSLLTAPLLPGEKWADYNWLQKTIFEAIRPTDAIETIWAKDIADAIFEMERLRRFKAKYIASGRRVKLIEAIAQISARDPGGMSPTKVAETFVNECLSERDGERKILAKLAKAGLDPEFLLAETAWERLEALERFEALIIQAENKRDALIWQLDRYRNRAAPKRRNPGIVDLLPEEFGSS